jgi:hypothetical protein
VCTSVCVCVCDGEWLTARAPPDSTQLHTLPNLTHSHTIHILLNTYIAHSTPITIHIHTHSTPFHRTRVSRKMKAQCSMCTLGATRRERASCPLFPFITHNTHTHTHSAHTTHAFAYTHTERTLGPISSVFTGGSSNAAVNAPAWLPEFKSPVQRVSRCCRICCASAPDCSRTTKREREREREREMREASHSLSQHSTNSPLTHTDTHTPTIQTRHHAKTIY